MTGELLKEEEFKTIKLADKEYKLSPLNLNVMLAIEEEFDCNFADFGKVLTGKKTKQLTSIGKLLAILLKENHPDLLFSDIGKAITVNNLEMVSDAIGSTLFGDEYIKFKEVALGK